MVCMIRELLSERAYRAGAVPKKNQIGENKYHNIPNTARIYTCIYVYIIHFFVLLAFRCSTIRRAVFLFQMFLEVSTCDFR